YELPATRRLRPSGRACRKAALPASLQVTTRAVPRGAVMRRILVSSFLLAAFLASSPTPAASTSVLISEFRTRGPNGANDAFGELFHPTNSGINIANWTLMVSDGNGNTSVLKLLPTPSGIAPGRFYLFANNGAQGYSGTTVPNAVYTSGIPDDGGIAILNASN